MLCLYRIFFFFKQKTAYELRISDWSSDVCSSDLEAPLECTRRDAAVQIFPLAVVLGTRAGDGEQVLLGDDLDIFGSEARDRERDAVAVLAILQDVEGRIAVILASPCLEQVEQAIETDRRPPIGCEVKCGSHFQILLMKRSGHELRRNRKSRRPLCPAGPEQRRPV